AEFGGVRYVECFETQFKVGPLANREVLEQRKVSGEEVWTGEEIPAGGPVTENARRHQRKGRCSDATGQVAIAAMRGGGTHKIGPIGSVGAGVSGIRAGADIERESALHGRNAIELPVSEYVAQHRIRALEERDVIHVAGDEA